MCTILLKPVHPTVGHDVIKRLFGCVIEIISESGGRRSSSGEVPPLIENAV